MTETMYLFNEQKVDSDAEWGRVFSYAQFSTAGVLPYYYMPYSFREVIDPLYSFTWNQPMVTYGRNAGMTVRTLAGAAMYGGRLFYTDSSVDHTIETADATNPRIDAVVIDFDTSSEPITASFVVITGTPAASPSPPTLTKSTTQYQVLLAYVYVDASVTNIPASNCYEAREYCTPIHTMNFIVGDGTNLITAGTLAHAIRLPRAIQFIQADLYADQSGSIDLDISIQSFASSPSTSNSIIAAPATTWGLSSSQSNCLRRMDGLTGITAWNKSNSDGHGIDAGNYMTLSCSNITSVTKLWASLSYFDLGNKEIL
jgi:hypothetical protein